MNSENKYYIRLPKDDDERKLAIAYLSEHMFKKHNGHPPVESTPKHLFIALEGDTVVGTVGIEFGALERPLPFEELYDLGNAVLPVSYDRTKTIYYSRWNSSRPELGPVLWLVATEYAIRQGIIHGIAITKADMIDYCAAVLGFDWRIAHGATIVREHIGPSEEKYFFGEHSPLLCFGILDEDMRTLRSRVREIRSRRNIVIDEAVGLPRVT